MAWRIVFFSLIALGFSLASPADTVDVAGDARPLTAPLIVRDGEVLAPLASLLPRLGIKVFPRADFVSFVLPDGSLHRAYFDGADVHGDAKALPLRVPPRMVGTNLYLPAIGLSARLPFAARFQAATRALTLLPKVQVSCDVQDGVPTVRVRATMPLHFTRGALDNPPRVYVDLPNVALDTEVRQIPVKAGHVAQIRLHQEITPPRVRLVIDLDADTPMHETLTDGDRLLTITPGVAAARQTFRLTDAALGSPAQGISELKITANAAPAITTDSSMDGRALVLTFADSASAIPVRRLRALRDARIARVTVARAGTAVKMTITFATNSCEHALSQDGTTVVVRVTESPLRGMVLVLDAGHGGTGTEGPYAGPGAIGCGGAMEREVNLDVVLRLQRLLARSGATILLTRQDAGYVSLDARVALANARQADVFISVHCNSTVSPTAGGTETYYYAEPSAELAQALHAGMMSTLKLADRGVRGNGDFQVIRCTCMPAVLVELAFISNPKEEALLKSPEFRQRAAEGLATGLRRYATATDWRAWRKPTAVPPAKTLTRDTPAPKPPEEKTPPATTPGDAPRGGNGGAF